MFAVASPGPAAAGRPSSGPGAGVHVFPALPDSRRHLLGNTTVWLLLNSFRLCKCVVSWLRHTKKKGGKTLPAEPVMQSPARIHQHSPNHPQHM